MALVDPLAPVIHGAREGPLPPWAREGLLVDRAHPVDRVSPVGPACPLGLVVRVGSIELGMTTSRCFVIVSTKKNTGVLL